MASFEAFAARKSRTALIARLSPLETINDCTSRFALEEVGNEWTRSLYDGGFHFHPLPSTALPALNLIFVQSRDGNTSIDDPAELGGGETDKHLLYEGLSRVAVDAVLSGATTASGSDVFFSTWHPQLVGLRRALGLPRHPAQIVVTGRGCIDISRSLIFNVPEVPAFILGSRIARASIADAVKTRPWVTVIPIEENGLRGALIRMRRDHGIRRISAIGGRKTATALVDEGLVQDLYLTTTEAGGGDPDTPWYGGSRPPRLDAIVTKRGRDPNIMFEHFRLRADQRESEG